MVKIKEMEKKMKKNEVDRLREGQKKVKQAF